MKIIVNFLTIITLLALFIVFWICAGGLVAAIIKLFNFGWGVVW